MRQRRYCLHCHGEREHVVCCDQFGILFWCQSCFRVTETVAARPASPMTGRGRHGRRHPAAATPAVPAYPAEQPAFHLVDLA